MNIYHGWCDLKPGVSDVTFAESVAKYMGHLEAEGLIEGWRLTRRKLGLGIAGFPNLFTITGPGSPSVLTNMMVSIEHHVNWIADCIGYLRDNGKQTIEALPERERQVLALRFAADLTQAEIAARIGVSQMHVSRLIRRALHRLTTVAEA